MTYRLDILIGILDECKTSKEPNDYGNQNPIVEKKEDWNLLIALDFQAFLVNHSLKQL